MDDPGIPVETQLPMKKYILIAFVIAILSGCFLYVRSQGDAESKDLLACSGINSAGTAIHCDETLTNTFTMSTGATAFTLPTGMAISLPSNFIDAAVPAQAGQSGKYLTTNGTNTSWASVPTAPGANNAKEYSAGTAYNITTTPAKLDFGTTDTVVTIPAAGTYLITSNVRIDYSGLTNLAANTVTVKLRRTNNTAADVANATGDFIVPPVTLLTSTGGDCDVATVIYTTANSNDVIELWGSRSASVSVGQIQAGSAWIVATRIY